MNNLKLQLVTPQTQAVTPLKDDKLKLQIVQSIAMGECALPQDVMEKFGLTFDNVMAIMSDPQFLSNLKSFTRAKLNMHFHSVGVTKLTEAVESPDIKTAIQAIKLQAQLSDNLKSTGTEVNVNLNLEQMVAATEKQVTPSALSINRAEPIIDLPTEKVG